MNTTPHDHTSSAADDELLNSLRRVLDLAEPVPEDSLTLAKAAIDWRSLDAELAQLVHDSAVDGADMLVRGATEEMRVLSFATADVQIDVEYAGGQLVGQVSPPEAAIIKVCRGEGDPVASTTTDEFGAFTITDVAAGPLSLLCESADGRWGIQTQWTAV